MDLQNIGILPQHYTVTQPRRLRCAFYLLPLLVCVFIVFMESLGPRLFLWHVRCLSSLSYAIMFEDM